MKTFEEKLVPATADWVGAGVITEVQREAILQRHPVPVGGGSRFVAILSTVGGLLFAVGISLLVKSNWELLGDWTKILGLVVLLVVAYAAGWWLKISSGRYPKVGDAFFMIGGLLFLSGIALVSQIFHLNARPATGLFVWWLGIVAVPWITRSKGAQFISLVALLTWLGMEMATRGSWIVVSNYGNHDELIIFSAFFLLGLAVLLAGLAFRGSRWADFSGLHEKWGIIIAAVILYVFGFLRHFGHWSTKLDMTHLPMSIVLGAGLAAVAALLAWRSNRKDLGALAPWLGLTLVPIAGILFVGPFDDNGWLWSAVSWVCLFAFSLAIIRVGLETGREGWVNLGILFVAVNIVTRYFDLFGTMLDGGLFFIVTGILVIALGIYLEKKRRSLLAGLRKEMQS